MRKFIVAGILIVLGLLLTAAEVSWVKESQTSSKVRVVAIAKAITAGDKIRPSDLKYVELDEALYYNGYIDDQEIAIGQTVRFNMQEKTLVTRQHLEEQAFNKPGEGNSMTALKLEPELALCWAFEIGESVCVTFTDVGGSYTNLGQVKIKAVYDSYMEAGGMSEYVLLEGDSFVISNIVKHRKLGRLELVKQDVSASIK